tara:strand:+ start:193 stop:354 length:162 start_codon:yes stop_codon:yes gene_type:complete
MIDASKLIAAYAGYFVEVSDSVRKYQIHGEKIFQLNENSRKGLIDYNLDDLSI